MVKKMKPSGGGSEGGTSADAKLAGTVKQSATQIWLAGLGAFAKAQEEGSKVFDALVREGLSTQRRTQAAAEEKLSEASTRMASMAAELSSRASGQWDKLEGIFEQRVSKAMAKLGVPTSRDLESLAARIDELNRNVARLSAQIGTPAKARRAARPAAQSPAKAPAKAPAKKAARKTTRKSS
jgi:poly(hydroxyalkanoate) granule-associated protein